MLVDGLLLIDKPLGMTSNSCVQQVRRLLNIKKAGHTGVLDPLATGLLPVCCGKATRLANFIQDADKSYQATIKFGVQTDTGDAEGTIINRSEVPTITKLDLDEISKRLTGTIEQTPPVYSAIKRHGKPMYYWARKAKNNKNIEVPTIASRKITIHSLSIRANDALNNHFDIEVHCSKGTYIRTLAEQITAFLHTHGHLTRLRRTSCGSLHIEDAVVLDTLEHKLGQGTKAWIQMIDMLPDIPRIQLTNENAQKLCSGIAIGLPNSNLYGTMLAVSSTKLLALVRFDQGTLIPIKVFSP